jgi:hypothetical protein
MFKEIINKIFDKKNSDKECIEQHKELSVSVNITNKVLLQTEGAANTAGETPVQQYTDFETAVKNKAKDLGFAIFA